MQANRLIRVTNEFGNNPNLTTLLNLTQSKIFALLDLPTDQRDDFVSPKHEIKGQTKTVDEMTTKELQQTIKDKKLRYGKR